MVCLWSNYTSLRSRESSFEYSSLVPAFNFSLVSTIALVLWEFRTEPYTDTSIGERHLADVPWEHWFEEEQQQSCNCCKAIRDESHTVGPVF